MNNQDKQTLKQWGTFILLALAAIFAIAASFGSIKFARIDHNPLYWVAGIANLCGWVYLAWKAINKHFKSE